MKINDQIKFWKYAAWTLPFTALAGIAFSYWIGYETYLGKFLIVIATVFFTISVFWWWWALEKLGKLMKDRFSLLTKLDNVMKELRDLRKDITKK